MKALTHGETMGRQCYKAVLGKYGAGWYYMSNDARYNALCAEVVSILVAQNEQFDGTLDYLKEIVRVACAEEERLEAKARKAQREAP